MLFAAETAEALSSGWFLEHAWLIPLIPAIAFAVIIGFGKRLPQGGSEVGIASMTASFVLACGATYQWIQRVHSADEHGEEGALGLARGFAQTVLPRASEEGGHSLPYVEPVIKNWTWWQNGGLELTIGQHVDGLAIMALLLVSFISLFVQIYSTEYVKGDRRYTHFFASLTLFSAGMLVMVLAESMVQFILGWEIMGLCSFLLIGHWWEDRANSEAALKAFWTVRVGDVGLLVGTAIIYFGASEWAQERGSNGFSIQAISGWAMSSDASQTVLLWGSVALFIACIGKSGQFPLHTWLPDAMAGPTPVSSLLHSSTMVVAGVYLVARLYPVFFTGLEILDTGYNLIAIVGGITIIVAAALAFVQNDIKKVLAYSTVSQLGYMMMGLGVGAWTPAVFHIWTHAFFKCCLFLAAGSISHSASHHSFDMKKDMGGLRKFMPITFWTWMVSTAALCGIPLFSGFWSKDEIIDNAANNDYTVFFVVGLAGAVMTAAYMTRATYLTFFGEPRGAAAGEHHGDDEHAEEHELELATVGGDLAGHGATLTDADLFDSTSAASGGDDHDHVHDDHGGDDHGGDDHDHVHDDHAGPHESPPRITVPLIILGFLAVFSGYLLAPGAPFKTEYFLEWVEPRGVEVEDVVFTPSGEASGHEDTEEAVGVVAPAIDASAFGRAAPLPTAESGEGEKGELTGCGFDKPTDGVCFAPKVPHAVFKWSKAAISIALVFFGIALSAWLCLGVYGGRKNPFAGLTQRSRVVNAGHQFLVNKLYLDDLYGAIIHAVGYPIAKASYWFNQHVIDGVVDGTGRQTRKTGVWVYRNVDQRVVDGAVDATGTVANESGEALQPVQSGKVNQYGALLFAAATVGAIVLILTNV
ncbi:NADH-quinone oxidoreductase subunit L [Ilumatobacter sp.]|uniref:NADH-quinone oxidoreductase subunit 5 family protein n=1 Tax=Ilumatobacter sp. TaxID=1967498 RepID=UPI003AF6AF56